MAEKSAHQPDQTPQPQEATQKGPNWVTVVKWTGAAAALGVGLGVMGHEMGNEMYDPVTGKVIAVDEAGVDSRGYQDYAITFVTPDGATVTAKCAAAICEDINPGDTIAADLEKQTNLLTFRNIGDGGIVVDEAS